jgi:hypothetical protein
MANKGEGCWRMLENGGGWKRQCVRNKEHKLNRNKKKQYKKNRLPLKHATIYDI